VERWQRLKLFAIGGIRRARVCKLPQREFAAGAYSFAMNRAYYALFYAVSALLLEEGRRFKKHSGVRLAFNREIIKSERMERWCGDLYNEIFDDRQAGENLRAV